MVLASQLPLSLSNAERSSAELPFTLPVVVKKVTVSSVMACDYSTPSRVRLSLHEKAKPMPVCSFIGFDYGVALDVMNHYNVTQAQLPVLISDSSVSYEESKHQQSSHFICSSAMGRLSKDEAVRYGKSAFLRACSKAQITPSVLLKSCVDEVFTPSVSLKSCNKSIAQAAICIAENSNTNYVKAVTPACEYIDIPIPEPEKPFNPNPCGLPPPASRLPLSMSHAEHHSLMLALPLACEHKPSIPLLSTYMIHNEITATLAGQNIGLINASIAANMDAFCWQLSSEITYADYKKFNLATRTDKPVLMIKINGLRWDIQLEEYSDSQAFISNRCTIKGRSITSQLSGSAVMRTPELIAQALNARQLIDKQLHLLPFTLSAYDAVDWLVPANTYTQMGSPMDTIIDIAQAGGHFVESHRFNPTLKVKKRWLVAAWQIKDQAATLTLPANVVLSLDGTKKDEMKYNSVYVMGSSQNAKGAKVYRQNSNKTPEGNTLTHATYTDVAVLRNAGIATLSDSGEHTPYTVKTLLSSKHNVRLAELGEICEITGAEGTIKGVVKSISVDTGTNNNAPEVTQTIQIDCYTGD